MAETTSIEWCDATWSPVWGCTQVSPACDNCYAKNLAHRFGHGWNGEPMREFGDEHWEKPGRWNKRAAADGKRLSVFPSMCDPFDKDWPAGVRVRFLRLIFQTPNLQWLLLTKRIGNVVKMLHEVRQEVSFEDERDFWLWLKAWENGEEAPSNVSLGSTVINQEEADRDIPKLLAILARVRFLSIEPMLGPIDLGRWLVPPMHVNTRDERGVSQPLSADGRRAVAMLARAAVKHVGGATIDWVIAGGESGPKARPAHPDWFRSLRDQCAASGVPFLFKQHGEWCSDPMHDTAPIEWIAPDGQHDPHPIDDGRRWTQVRRLGKKAAGRLLDGVEHNGFPS